MAGPIFVSFEGGEGSGKTTQATSLRGRLVETGYRTILVHEPGSTHFGDYIRRYLKGQDLSKEAELLLFAAARAQLVSEVIAPSLRAGINVVADRYADSTLAYQGYGRKLGLDTVRFLNSFATKGITPHLTFYLDMDPVVGRRRTNTAARLRGKRKAQTSLRIETASGEQLGRQEEEGQRKFEEQPLEFHRRVRRGYQALAREDPDRWVVLDATLPQEEIASRVWSSVASILR